MIYAAVVGYKIEKGTSYYHLVYINSEDNWGRYGDDAWLPENVMYTIPANGVVPVNFSIDRDGKVKQNCGDFTRFSKQGSAVVLAEMKSKAGRTLGYKLLSCANGVVVNWRLDDILQREKAYGSEHFLQNGIIRNNTVNCYPMKPFPVIVVEDKKPKKPAPQQAPVQIQKSIEPKKQKPVETKRQQFSPEQLAELNKCEKNGVNPRLIKNTELNPNQMRVLWVSKSKGALAERFNNSKLSVDAMKFYADRIYDKRIADECADMLAHPELSVDELNELYSCVCAGIPYSDYIGKSATDIQVARDMETQTYWGSSGKFDVDYYDKALNVVRKIKGY